MDKNRPLLVCSTYLKENGNSDICVSDAGSVVVTDAGGMLRFRYLGASRRNINFEPYGLCCDSVCNIIIVDMKNDRIHVIDKDCGFFTSSGMKEWRNRAPCVLMKTKMFTLGNETQHQSKLFHVNLKNYVLFFALIHETNVSLQTYLLVKIDITNSNCELFFNLNSETT